MQNDFVLSGAPLQVDGALQIIPKIAELLEVFRKEDLPVFHVTRSYSADGSDAEEVRKNLFKDGKGVLIRGTEGCEIVGGTRPAIRKNEYVIVKRRWSAFFATELDKLLRSKRVEAIALVGCSLPNCIRATVYDGVSLDYKVFLIEDAVAGPSSTFDGNMKDIRRIGVRILSVEEFVKMLKEF